MLQESGGGEGEGGDFLDVLACLPAVELSWTVELNPPQFVCFTGRDYSGNIIKFSLLLLSQKKTFQWKSEVTTMITMIILSFLTERE